MNTQRLAAYKKILEEFRIDPLDTSYSGAEDAAEYLSGAEEICRFCVVTQATTGDGLLTYAYAHDDDISDAKLRAEENIDDDLFAEYPVAIIDLDTGQRLNVSCIKAEWVEAKETAKA